MDPLAKDSGGARAIRGHTYTNGRKVLMWRELYEVVGERGLSCN